MLAVSITDLSKLQYPVLVTPKLDGIRCLKVNGKALTRKFKPIPNHHVRNYIEKYCPDGFDGEIICHGKTFNEIQSLIMTEEGEPEFQYWVFDYVKDNIEVPYEQRIQHLVKWMQNDPNMVSIIVLLPELIPDGLHLQIAENDYVLCRGYEGLMIRSVSGPYKCGRSTEKEGYLLKLKRMQDSEAEIIGFEEKLHNNNEATKDELGHTKRSHKKANLAPADTLGAILVKDINSGVEFSIGTGFDDETRKDIWLNRDKYLGKYVTYQFQAAGQKDKPRFPSFKGFRDIRDIGE